MFEFFQCMSLIFTYLLENTEFTEIPGSNHRTESCFTGNGSADCYCDACGI